MTRCKHCNLELTVGHSSFYTSNNGRTVVDSGLFCGECCLFDYLVAKHPELKAPKSQDYVILTNEQKQAQYK